MKHFKWDQIPEERLNDKSVRKLAWDGKIMVARTEVEQGYVVPLHAHDNEQVTWVMSGKWRFTVEGKTVDVGQNETISIPAKRSWRLSCQSQSSLAADRSGRAALLTYYKR